MENGQKERVIQDYRHLDIPALVVLDIPDDYEYLDEELIGLLTEKINEEVKIFFRTGKS
jgi:protein-tyrosine phosphatase